MCTILYIQHGQFFKEYVKFYTFNVYIFFFNECTLSCTFNIHNFSKNVDNFVYSIYKIFSKNAYNFVYSIYTTFHFGIFNIMCIQCT